MGSILSLFFYFGWKILLVISEDPDQRAHYVASDLGLHCLPMILLRSQGTCKDGLMGIFLLFSFRSPCRRRMPGVGVPPVSKLIRNK